MENIYSEIRFEKLPRKKIAKHTVISPNPEDDIISDALCADGKARRALDMGSTFVAKIELFEREKGWYYVSVPTELSITELCEPTPTEELLAIPGMSDELRRPMMLIISAKKK